jgi:hypothetical protein
LRIRIEKEMDFRVCVGTSKNAISTAFSECRFVAAKGLAAFYEKYKLWKSNLPYRLSIP